MAKIPYKRLRKRCAQTCCCCCFCHWKCGFKNLHFYWNPCQRIFPRFRGLIFYLNGSDQIWARRKHCSSCFWTIQWNAEFEKLWDRNILWRLRRHGLVVRAVASEARGPRFNSSWGPNGFLPWVWEEGKINGLSHNKLCELAYPCR